MEIKEIEEKVKTFLVEELEIEEDKIFAESTLQNDMGIGSLEIVDVIVFVENEFGFKMDPENFKTIKTFKDFCEFIQKGAKQ